MHSPIARIAARLAPSQRGEEGEDGGENGGRVELGQRVIWELRYLYGVDDSASTISVNSSRGQTPAEISTMQLFLTALLQTGLTDVKLKGRERAERGGKDRITAGLAH
jgi:hypothetical protein